MVTGAGPKAIEWKIVTAGFEFSREDYKFAIFIETDPGDEFQSAQVTGGNKQASIKYAKSATGKAFKYWLSVRRDSGAKAFCDPLDPWLIS